MQKLKNNEPLPKFTGSYKKKRVSVNKKKKEEKKANTHQLVICSHWEMVKSWEMVIHGKIPKPKSQPLQDIKRKESLKLLGITFQNKPTSWNIHIDKMLSKASSRLYIIRNCKANGYRPNNYQNY